MDVIAGGRERRPLRWSDLGLPQRLLAALLAVVIGGQAYALGRDRSLPDDVRIEIAEGGYVVGTLDDPSLVTFNMSSTGRPVDVRGIALSAPGITVDDVVASGAAVRFRRVGEGAAPLPTFRLTEGVVVILSVKVSDCAAIDGGAYPLRLDLASGYREGIVELRLRDYPDLTGNGGPDIPWQQVLAAAQCP